MLGRSLPYLTLVLLAGCAAPIETRITSSGLTDPAAQPYMFNMEVPSSQEAASARRLVESRLADHGYSEVKNGPLLLEVTLDSRDASLALGTAAGSDNLSVAKKRKALQNCKDREYRLGITLTRIADGAVQYQSRIAEYHCKMSLAEALPDMVKAGLTDLGQPRGSYTLHRMGRE